MRRSVLFRATGAVGLLTAVAVAAATMAGADATVLSGQVTPATVVLHASGTTTLRATVRANDGAGVLWADVDLRSAAGTDFNYVDNMAGSTAPGPSSWTGSVGFTKWYTTGKWYADIYVFSRGGGSTRTTRTFYVKRETRFVSFNASEPVRAGNRVSLSARLLRLDPAKGFVPYAGKKVQLQFLPSGSSTWRSKGTVTTNRVGALTARLAMTRPGSWRTWFVGTAHHAADASRADAVAYLAP